MLSGLRLDGTSCEWNDHEAKSGETWLTLLPHFSFYEALLIPFEISAFCLVASFWSPTVTEAGPVAGIVTGMIIAYA